jgi:Leucine-rich repeat (LRR) protein
MYRQVFTPNENNNIISIPPELYGKEIEVMWFPTDSVEDANIHLSKEQIAMLKMSENDILNELVVSEEELAKQDAQWLD